METKLILPFNEVGIKDVSFVGGKNASLGELLKNLKPLGINIPDGFATTADAFRLFLNENKLTDKLALLVNTLDKKEFVNLNKVSKDAKALINSAKLPVQLIHEITDHYKKLCEKFNSEVGVAVRSSATAEDLPTASFAGQHDSFLNIKGINAVLNSVQNCFASLYNARAIKYRIDNGFDHSKVALSVGIQLMVRSDKASSGVCFTIEPDSGFKNAIVITGCWGLGENIVQGTVTPDEFHVFKPHIGKFKRPVISKKLGSKAETLIYNEDGNGTVNTHTPLEKQKCWTLTNSEIETVAKWCLQIEQHYKMPMDVEWAKDGLTNQLFVVQARPETVHSTKDPLVVKEYSLKQKGNLIVTGNAIGLGIVSGMARVINSSADSDKLNTGEILITDVTNPDWDPILKKAAAIVTNKGGRTSHAAIVAREVGAIAIVGANGATEKIKDGDIITVDTSQGKYGSVYSGKLNWTVKDLDFRNIKMPVTQAMLILADPDKAYKLSFYPNKGVGLMRMEFVITNSIRVHPMALVKFDELTDPTVKKEIRELTEHYADKKGYFIDKLSQAIGTIAAAFYPKDVIVRMSDFKTNEYANLLGGKQFEMKEENPMIGFRGASRYYNDRYKEGFKLECEAMKVVRNEMGLTNVKLMIPFCRTVEEGKKVVSLMAEYGLKRGENGLEIYVMAEIPSNVILAGEFAKIFDGFSIGSNDLTQLTLGIDRDSDIISDLFDENNEAVKYMISHVINSAKLCGSKIGLCGQAPSDYPEFTEFLVAHGIDSISFNPDALLKGIENINKAETL
ncbi:phosphoenolpyruvate synthase [Aurantibacillus circumpalustris]|uniref:phosphoenolpyruvate synthase n=1 Tax=Aurantibacillus circumpalustris TaxID=3036359 RepID=UPI00295AFB4C|nr:phosphoenolpyruvate synthase [Aurantibacillus circumpalustris]